MKIIERIRENTKQTTVKAFFPLNIDDPSICQTAFQNPETLLTMIPSDERILCYNVGEPDALADKIRTFNGITSGINLHEAPYQPNDDLTALASAISEVREYTTEDRPSDSASDSRKMIMAVEFQTDNPDEVMRILEKPDAQQLKKLSKMIPKNYEIQGYSIDSTESNYAKLRTVADILKDMKLDFDSGDTYPQRQMRNKLKELKTTFENAKIIHPQEQNSKSRNKDRESDINDLIADIKSPSDGQDDKSNPSL